jgi:hypothetical protein
MGSLQILKMKDDTTTCVSERIGLWNAICLVCVSVYQFERVAKFKYLGTTLTDRIVFMKRLRAD